MKGDTYNLVPDWFKVEGEERYMMVGDDADSLLSAMVLEQYLGWKYNWFYDFESVHVSDKSISTRKRVGIDMALDNNEKTIDNHVTIMSNHEKVNPYSVNLNCMYEQSSINYGRKYAGSTLLLVWSLLGIPLPESDEGKRILLSIDSAHKGHYNKTFKETHNNWLKMLGFEELIEFLERTNKNVFYETQRDFSLNEKVYLDDNGKIGTRIDMLSVGMYLGIDAVQPDIVFEKEMSLTRHGSVSSDIGYEKPKNTFSFAMTGQGYASYTMMKDE